eukprot:PITA_34041
MALVGECVATEPSSFEEAVQQPVWMDAMVEEYDSIMRNSVWDVVPRLGDKSVVTSRWLYKVEGIDYDETFSPVARYSLIRSILALSAQMGDDELIKSCKKDLAREFEMKDMGLMHYFLGLEVWQRDGEVFVSQGNYANEILRRFHMDMCKPMETPLADNWRKEDSTSGEEVAAIVYWQLVGSLMYLVNTGPNLCFEVNQLSQAMVQPTKLYWKATKHVLRYLRGTIQYGLWYKWTEGVKLQGFTDADWAGSPSDRKRTFGGIFNIG